jgi:hypothetical protein
MASLPPALAEKFSQSKRSNAMNWFGDLANFLPAAQRTETPVGACCSY